MVRFHKKLFGENTAPTNCQKVEKILWELFKISLIAKGLAMEKDIQMWANLS